MTKGTYVILLSEAVSGSPDLGYWDGKVYSSGDSAFVGALDDQFDKRIKRYSSIKYAEKAAVKLELEIDQVAKATVIKTDI